MCSDVFLGRKVMKKWLSSEQVDAWRQRQPGTLWAFLELLPADMFVHINGIFNGQYVSDYFSYEMPKQL